MVQVNYKDVSNLKNHKIPTFNLKYAQFIKDKVIIEVL